MATSPGMPDPSSSALNTPSADTPPHRAHPWPGGEGGDARRDTGEVFARVVQGAHDTVDRLAETAAPHVQRLSQGVDSATDTLQQRAGEMRETGDAWAENLRETVRENPLAALAAALAVGVIVARLTS